MKIEKFKTKVINNTSLILLLIIISAFFVRTYKINSPIADWHSWRQVDTAAVARNYIKYGIDPLRPRYDDISNVQSGRDNPQGYRMVEFPLYQLIAVFTYKLFPVVGFEVVLRLVTILASVGIALFLYGILSELGNKWIGLLAAMFYAFLPYPVYYGRTILPDTLAVFFAVGAIYWIMVGGNKGGLIASGIFAALALLVKPTAGFLLLPVVYLAYMRWGRLSRGAGSRFAGGILGGIGMLGITILPLLAWRQWIAQFPEGIPAYEWLLNGDGIRFRPAFFRWIFYERLTKLILGYFLIPVFLVGVFGVIREIWFKMIRQTRQNPTISYDLSIVLFLWGIGVLVYLFTFATGNVRHDYYQIIITPVVCALLADGFWWLWERRLGILGILGILGVLVSWQTIKTYYWINDSAIIEAGQAADRILPQNAKVIAPYGSSTVFLYFTNRQGWPVGFEIEKKNEQGATAYVNTNVTDAETKYVMERWKTIIKTDKYVLVDLTKRN